MVCYPSAMGSQSNQDSTGLRNTASIATAGLCALLSCALAVPSSLAAQHTAPAEAAPAPPTVAVPAPVPAAAANSASSTDAAPATPAPQGPAPAELPPPPPTAPPLPPAPQAPQPAPVAPAAPAAPVAGVAPVVPATHPRARRPHLHVEGSVPLHVYAGAGPTAPLCQTPCDVPLPQPGGLAIGYRNRPAITVPRAALSARPDGIRVKYRSRSGSRLAGWIALGVGLGGGAASAALGGIYLTGSCPSGQNCEAEGAGNLVVGAVLATAGLITGLILLSKDDSIETTPLQRAERQGLKHYALPAAGATPAPPHGP